MSKLIYLVIGIVVGYMIARVQYNFRLKKDSSASPQNDNSLNQQREREHQQQLDKILAGFSVDDEITNDKVQAMLGVSDTTVGRYLDELEKMGKLQQVGKTGKYVTYKKI
jgi:predicted HTH transcriptional regulator